MSSTCLLPPINGGHLLFSLNHHRLSATPTPYKWGWRRYQAGNIVAYRTNGHALQMLPNPNASQKKGNNEVIMVDPLEAKRLAAKQMEEIKAKENFRRKRQIEAINGAWAMIGLTAGLVIEGQTGKSILVQLADYWSAIVDFFML
ncbi:uncharacterized protein LOC133712890 isoform X1 [Rosa rugosa]|uniref:uncharacterized protein LOC133712890 isoform X1 n=2 Tax=Rosa rugosa TaxID=74645 RepID=UPI002B4153D4|nr:uncharacterized protein LOC133712890 isoform X1 [Rosa rugosa]